MKNRRFALTAFLIVAVLVMGIGFAALVDTLTINGDVTFNPAGAVIGEKAGAIKFSSDPDDTVAIPDASDTTAAVTVTANVLADESASVNVIINGVTDQQTPYVGTAKFVVLYETTNTTLNPVYIYPTFESEVDTANGFTVELLNEDGSAFVQGTEMAPGARLPITVRVTYDPTVNPAITNGSAAHVEHFILDLIVEDSPRA